MENRVVGSNHLFGIPGKERNNGREAIFEDVMVENFPDTNPQTQAQ